MLSTIFIAALCATSLAQPNLDKIRNDFQKLQAGKHSIPVVATRQLHYDYTQDCFADASLKIKAGAASLLQHHNVPGAGIVKFKPFEKVLKDGFALTDCVRDYMYERGDKFGDNKHDYKLGPVSNVSIVHYEAFVAKEDRVDMTQKVCFEFCRTIPNMGFFGIVNGRGCYCTPYFKPMASDSTQCDAHCEGDKTKFCGGKSKASIFTMHMCDSTKEDLMFKTEEAKNLATEMKDLSKKATQLSDQMQNLGADLQKRFGAVGDSGATRLLQQAKVFAGELVHKAEDTDEEASALSTLVTSSGKLKDFTSSDTVTKAERIMEGLDEATEKSETVHDELVTMEAQAKGELRPNPALVSKEGEAGYGASFLESISMEQGNYSAAVATVKKEVELTEIGKNQMYNPGPWFRICQDSPWYKVSGHMGCPLEACGAMAVAAKECDGYFERWEIYKEDWIARYGRYSMCICKTGMKFDESKQWKLWGYPNNPYWNVKTYKYTVEKKFNPLDQYYPVMYFVDKTYEEVPTTCDGGLVGTPIVGQSARTCAASCDSHIHDCVGFQYFETGKDSLCFLLSGYKTGFYYTGCGKAFLQTDKAPFEAKCYAKLSKFVGTTLKPNPSGKCKECFKDLTKADRCYK
jgi:hypothetical protein